MGSICSRSTKSRGVKEEKQAHLAEAVSISKKENNKEKQVMALEKVTQIAASNPVAVFSKSYCPYCNQVKNLLSSVGANYKAVELDAESDGSEIQAALHQWTGQRTVPNVFIGGKHIGGCDSTVALHNQGKLVPLLTEAGALQVSAHSA